MLFILKRFDINVIIFLKYLKTLLVIDALNLKRLIDSTQPWFQVKFLPNISNKPCFASVSSI